MITVSDIDKFLKDVRCFIDKGKTDFIYSKGKYALGKLGISIDDAFAMVYELTHKDYYRGPTPDHDYKDQEVMEFGLEDIFPDMTYPSSSLYIKLTFRPRKDDLLMMSFHPATDPITYPHGKDKLSLITE